MTEAIVRSEAEHDLPRALNLYRHLHPHDPQLETATAERVLSTFLTSGFMTVIVAQAAELLVSSCTFAIVPNLSRGGRSYGVIENVVTQPTTVGWGSADGLLLMRSMLLGRPTATKSYWRRVRSGRPPYASMRERAFIVGAEPTSKYAVLGVQFSISYDDPVYAKLSAPTTQRDGALEQTGGSTPRPGGSDHSGSAQQF